jgi:hypothetical protein
MLSGGIKYKQVCFNYVDKKIKIVWNFKNRFDVFTIDDIGYESFLNSVQHYLKNKNMLNAEMVADDIVKDLTK